MNDLVDAGELTFPSPLPVQPEAWGHSFKTVISGIPLALTLPERSVSAGPGVVRPSAVRRVAMAWPQDVSLPSLSELHAFERSVAEWFRNVMTWICAWTGLAPPVDRSVDPILELFDQDGQLAKREQGEFLFYGFADELGATRDQLKAAFIFAADRITVPTAYALLVDAQAAFGDFRNRVCVMSAAAAVEVASGRTIERALAERHCPEEFVRWVTSHARGVLALDQVCRSLGAGMGASRSDVESLAKARNAAAHAGSEMDRGETATLLQVAQTMLRTLNPLTVPRP